MPTPRKPPAKPLSELLVERRLITPEQLQEAVAIQQRQGGLLGQLLIRLGHITEEAIAQALTTQYGFAYLPVQNYTIDPAVVQLIPENVARQYLLIAVDRLSDALMVAMADPLNTKAIEDIEGITHCAVRVFVATFSAVAHAIDHYYPHRP